MNRRQKIETGLKALLEEKLEKLEYAVRNKDDPGKEVDNYKFAHQIAEKEGLNVSGYREKYDSLVKIFWKIKNNREKQI